MEITSQKQLVDLYESKNSQAEESLIKTEALLQGIKAEKLQLEKDLNEVKVKLAPKDSADPNVNELGKESKLIGSCDSQSVFFGF
jgi:hypothetical protein